LVIHKAKIKKLCFILNNLLKKNSLKYKNKNYDNGMNDFLFENKKLLDLNSGINFDLLDAANFTIKLE
jgi:hypothetical protein